MYEKSNHERLNHFIKEKNGCTKFRFSSILKGIFLLEHAGFVWLNQHMGDLDVMLTSCLHVTRFARSRYQIEYFQDECMWLSNLH